MQTGNLEFILAWASILGAVLAASGFLHREMREGLKRQDERFDERFDRFDKRFDLQDEKFRQLGEQLTAVRVGVARIEGHRGFGFDASAAGLVGERRTDDAPPERAA